jgi:hypothetical protein
MSRKSLFNGFSHESPGVHRKLPHHGNPLLGRGLVKVALAALVSKPGNSNR